MLKAAGYDNVVYYVSLDGHGTDWPDGAGIIGDFNIDKTAQAVNKVNFRVESGLGECVVDLLRKKLHESQPGSVSDYAWSILIGALDDTSLVQYFKDLDLKAPYRFGGSVRDNPTIVGAQGTPSESQHHTGGLSRSAAVFLQQLLGTVQFGLPAADSSGFADGKSVHVG